MELIKFLILFIFRVLAEYYDYQVNGSRYGYREMFGQKMLSVMLDIPDTSYITGTPTFPERYISSLSCRHIILHGNKYRRY